MLRLQQLQLKSKNKFFLKLFLFSTVVHIFVCILFFFFYSNGSSGLKFTVNSQKSDNITLHVAHFIPEKKVAPQTQKQSAAKQTMVIKKTQQNTIEKKVKKKEQKKVAVPKQAAPKIEQKIQKLNKAELANVVQKMVADVWAPPEGMAQDLVCEVRLTIDWNGNITNYLMTKSSNVLVYDTAVEHAVYAMKIPRQLWGKTFDITFNP